MLNDLYSLPLLQAANNQIETSTTIMEDRTGLSMPSSKVVVPRVELPNEKIAKWNTTNLGLRVGADAASAATASVLVAPIICVIDKSIVQKAASGDQLSRVLGSTVKQVLLRPDRFLVSRPFLLIFSLYFSTYFAANTIDTATSTINAKPSHTVTSSANKFVVTSAVNMSICVYKDSQFARMFGNAASPTTKMSKMTYILFAMRDSMTVFASFNLPHIIAPQLLNLPPSIQKRFSGILSTEAGRTNTAQFVTPAAMQIFSTPIHLLGLDLYNRQGRLGFAERMTRIKRDWAVSAIARMGRIVPAFGVGGVVNSHMRRSTMAKIEDSSKT